MKRNYFKSILSLSPLYKAVSLGLCLYSPLQAITLSPQEQACQSAVLAQLNGQGRTAVQGCPVSERLIYWLGILRNPEEFTPQELIGFLETHAHWPQHETLCRNAEEVIAKQGSSVEVLTFFNTHPPQTPEGVLAYGKALLAHNERTKEARLAEQAWKTMDLTQAEEKKFISRFGHLLQEKDHVARLNRLLMDEDVDAAKRMFPHVPVSVRKIAQARMNLIQGGANAHQTVASFSGKCQDEGLCYDLTKWHRKEDQFIEAAAYLIRIIPSSQTAEKWWKERNYIARELMAVQDFTQAYAVLRNHRLDPGSQEYAEAQWLLGWLSLRFLNNPGEALNHFQKFSANVKAAISKSRGAYWLGRTYETMGNLTEARKSYQKGAHFKTTYYGQLAAAKLHQAPYPALTSSPKINPVDKIHFEQNDLVQAAMVLSALGQGALHELRKFFLQIAEQAQTRTERELAIEMAYNFDKEYVVWAGKKVGFAEPILLKKIFPTFKIPNKGQKIPEKSFVMSIIYQESRFMPREKSSAGAMGLMQLIPATAIREAKRVGVPFSESKLFDSSYNLVLGSSHLSYLLDRFNGSYILTAAAYNAGPVPVTRWLDQIGDPREKNIDVVDWIELIPYKETRNYVQRVLENIGPYRSLDGKPKHTIIDDLQR